ncbi:MAG: hypothetical protein EP343_21760 [Deltaproteobacteria bacterium]|nr:MAG: hypothetical protein EP343_21760 [Deltaproteobacteria bacterium]
MMRHKTIGSVARKLRKKRGWSEEELARRIHELYNGQITPHAIKALESSETGTLRLVTLVFGALWDVPKANLLTYFQDMIRQINHVQSFENGEGPSAPAPGAYPEP